MVIFGIDPGSIATGYGVVAVAGNRARWLDSGTVRPPAKAGLAEKLQVIYDRLMELMAQHHPGYVCIEEAFYAKNVHTTLVLGHARGVAMLAARKSGAHVAEYSPRTVKKSVVGSGAASKEQVGYMIRMLLSPPAGHDQEDACDALAVALCGMGELGAALTLESAR